MYLIRLKINPKAKKGSFGDRFPSLETLDDINYKSIVIDEAQFFDDLTDAVAVLLQMKKFVYVCGLDGDFKMRKFKVTNSYVEAKR